MDMWDSALNGCLSNLPVMVISVCGTCSKYNYICYNPWDFLPGYISLFYGGII